MRTMGIDFDQLTETMVRLALFQLSMAIVILIALLWAAYLVIRAGVRDGIREAQPRERRPINTMPATPPGYKWTLTKDDAPDHHIRAD
jgi:hypothetical protein